MCSLCFSELYDSVSGTITLSIWQRKIKTHVDVSFRLLISILRPFSSPERFSLGSARPQSPGDEDVLRNHGGQFGHSVSGPLRALDDVNWRQH